MRGRARQGSARVCLFWGGVVRNSDPRDRREDAGNSLLQPVAMAAYFREASKGEKKKRSRRKPKHFIGREEK